MSTYETIYEQARILAEAIANSEELRRVKESELAVMLDMEAREIIEEFQQIQMDAINQGIGYEDLPQESKERLDVLEGKMNENEIIKEYMECNQNFNEILQSVNMIIGNAITGNEGGCSSCGSASACASGSCSCGGSC